MAYIVMAFVIMAYIVMAFVIMAYTAHADADECRYAGTDAPVGMLGSDSTVLWCLESVGHRDVPRRDGRVRSYGVLYL